MIDRRRLLMTATAVVAGPRILRAAESDAVRFGVLYPNLTTVIHEIAKRTGCLRLPRIALAVLACQRLPVRRK